jgi:hypothetical protein
MSCSKIRKDDSKNQAFRVNGPAARGDQARLICSGTTVTWSEAPLWHKARVFWANIHNVVRGEETKSNRPQTPVWSARQNTLPFITSNVQTMFTKGSMAFGSTEKAIYWRGRCQGVNECCAETLLYCVRKSSKSQCLLKQRQESWRMSCAGKRYSKYRQHSDEQLPEDSFTPFQEGFK